MNTLTNHLQRCLLIMALLAPSLLFGQVTKACFKARVQTPERKVMNVQLTSSDTILLNNLGTIYALSIDATIEQPRESSFVRLVLEDVEGHNYLVAESDRFRNDTSVVNLSEYCEETAQLNGITPLRLKCYLTNASLQLTDIHISNEIPSRGNATAADIRTVKEEQVQDIVDRINEYNVRHGKLWYAATTLAAKEFFSEKQRRLGMTLDYNTLCMEYYAGGFFEMGNLQNMPRSQNTNYVNVFDWTNRHGKNWITSIKNQRSTHYCTSFATIAGVEAMANLYFNDTINMNHRRSDPDGENKEGRRVRNGM